MTMHAMQSTKARQCNGVNGELSTISVTLTTVPRRAAAVFIPELALSVAYQIKLVGWRREYTAWRSFDGSCRSSGACRSRGAFRGPAGGRRGARAGRVDGADLRDRYRCEWRRPARLRRHRNPDRDGRHANRRHRRGRRVRAVEPSARAVPARGPALRLPHLFPHGHRATGQRAAGHRRGDGARRPQRNRVGRRRRAARRNALADARTGHRERTHPGAAAQRPQLGGPDSDCRPRGVAGRVVEPPQAGMHSGASVNAVTRSGTNAFHGNVFEFVRDRRFNSKSPFAAIGPDGKKLDDGLNRNQFGGTLGGPLKHDRIFFFGAYQGTRRRQVPVDNISFVPTAAMLAGDFTQLAAPACNGGRTVALRAPFANNTVARSALSPAALAITSKLPQSTDPCGRVVYGLATNADELQSVGKVDVQLSNKQSVFGRYMATTYVSDPPFLTSENLLTTRIGGRDNLAQSFTAGHTLIVNADTVNSIRFAFNRTSVHRTNADTFGAPDVGINIFSYMPKYSLVTVNNAFSI